MGRISNPPRAILVDVAGRKWATWKPKTYKHWLTCCICSRKLAYWELFYRPISLYPFFNAINGWHGDGLEICYGLYQAPQSARRRKGRQSYENFEDFENNIFPSTEKYLAPSATCSGTWAVYSSSKPFSPNVSGLKKFRLFTMPMFI